MGQFLSYTLQAAVVMAMLYLVYKWLMSQSTFHGLNRASLLATIAVSWALPALIPLFTPRPVVDVEFGLAIPLMTEGTGGVADTSRHITLTWQQTVIILYCGGVLIAAVITAVGACRMARIIRGGMASRLGRYTLVISADAPGPFSWGRYIVIRPEDCDCYRDMVIAHEKAHLDRIHWVDLLVAQCNVILQWFNPAAWLVMHEMKYVHEYQADAAAGEDTPHDYRIMLLKKTVGASFPTFADSLNHSQIKQRLTMMMKSRTRAWRRLSAMAIPAMTIVAAFTLSIPAVAGILDSISRTDIIDDDGGKVTNSTLNGQIRHITILGDTPALTAEDSPAVTGNEAEPKKEVMMDEVTVVKYDEDTQKDTKFTPAYFVDGTLFTGTLNHLDPQHIKSMTIVKDDPAYPQGKIMIEMLKPGEDKVHATAQKCAEFKGGQEEMIEFLKQNLKFPEDVRISKPVRVIVQFVVGTDGSVSNARIMRGASEEALNTEALRVVGLMSGHWSPGSNNGTPVATYFTLPVQFSPDTPEEK